RVPQFQAAHPQGVPRMIRRCTCFACPAVVLAVAVLIALPNRNVGQTSDGKKGIATPSQAKHVTAMLDRPIDVNKDLVAITNLKDFLLALADRLRAEGSDAAVVVDDEGFRSDNPEAADIHDTPVNFKKYQHVRRMTLKTAL